MQAASVGRAIRDGDWELFEWDPITGRSVWIMEQGGQTVVRTDYPVDGILKANAEARSATPEGWKGDWHRIASVPLNLLHDRNLGLHKAMVEGDDKYLSRWLNDSDNAAFRTKEGRV